MHTRSTEPAVNEDISDRMTHQAYATALLCTKEDPIIRVRRNLLVYNCGGLFILHKRRLKVALFMEVLGASVDTFGESKPTFERFRIIFQRLPMVFGAFC